MEIEGGAFGKIYENFLGKFAMGEGQKDGEFFTPAPIVKPIAEMIEPYHGLWRHVCVRLVSGEVRVKTVELGENHGNKN